LAPELFQVGSKLTTAVDTFSFGIMVSFSNQAAEALGELNGYIHMHTVFFNLYISLDCSSD